MVVKHVTNPDDLIEILNGSQIYDTVHVRFNLQKVKPGKIDALANGLKRTQNVVELEMSNCDIRADQAATILAAIRQNPQLKKLDISKNYFEKVTRRAVSDLLLRTDSISSLSIERTRLTTQAICQVFASLAVNKTLRSFNVADLRIKEAGFVQLNKALTVNRTLLQIDLSKTITTEAEVRLLASGLKENRTLQTLIAWDNELRNVKTAILFDALKDQHSLSTIDLRYNKIGGIRAARSISSALKRNSTLTSVRLDFNDLADNEREQIATALLSNNSVVAFELDKSESAIHAELNEVISCTIQRNKLTQRHAFYKALSSGEKQPWNRSKLMLIGEGKVGKTATVRSLLNRKFDPEWKSTVGIDVTEVTTANPENWSSMGSSRDFTSNFINRAAAKTLERKEEPAIDLAKEDISEVAASIELSNELVISEYEKQDTEEETVRQYDERAFVQVYSENQHNAVELTFWDYGGQRVFQSLHQLFLSDFGVYLLVVDLRAVFRKEYHAFESIKFWLHSVKLHAADAPILIAGTFAGDLREKDQAKATEALKAFIQKQLPEQKGEVDVCLLDNRTGKGVQALRDSLARVTRTLDHIHLKVSVKWMQILDALLAVENSWMSYERAKTIANEVVPMTDEEMENMLRLFHELGVVLHFNSTQALSALVTTRPQWLIDSISLVIRDKSIHRYDPQALEQAGLAYDAEKLLANGLATRDLLHFLWKATHVDFLIDLMRSLLLLSNWQYSGSESSFIVPSMLPRLPALKSVRKVDGLKMTLGFSYLLPGIYERLICILVHTQRDTKEPVLSRTESLVHFNSGYAATIVPSSDCLTLTVDTPRFARDFATLVLFVMERIKSEVMGDRLRYKTKVEVKGKMVAYNQKVRRGASVWGARKKKKLTQRIGSKVRLSFETFV